MRILTIAGAVVLAGALISRADPTAACTNLVGTYAEPRSPEKPLLTVSFANGQFAVADNTGKKQFVSATPTAQGLVIVEDPRDRNVFRLSAAPKPGVYLFEHFGRNKDGAPLPEKPKRARELVRVQPAQNNAENK